MASVHNLLPSKRSRPGRFGWTLALATSLVVALPACRRATPDSGSAALESLAPAWSVGQSYRYSVDLKSRVGMGQQPAAATGLSLQGVLEVTPLIVDGKDVQLGVVLSNVKLVTESGDPAVVAPLVRELEKPAAFTLSDGKVSETRFAPGLSAVAISIERTLSSALQFTPPPSSARTWRATERDATGEYTVEYDARGGSLVSRRKVEFTQTLTAGKLDDATRARIKPKIVQSSGHVRLDHGTMAEIHLDDGVETVLLERSSLAVHTTLALALRKGDPSPGSHLDREQLLTQTVAVSPNNARADKLDGLFDKVRIGNETYESVLSELERQANDPKLADLWAAKNDEPVTEDQKQAREQGVEQRIGSFSTLVAILRQQPAAIEKAKASIAAQSPASKALMSGLASAGTPKSQAVLAEIVTNAALPKRTRAEAATRFIQLREPTPESVATLKRLLDDPLLGQHALYGLGIFARYLRDAGHVDQSTPLSELLVQRLRAAQAPRDQIAALRAIANSAWPGALPALKPLLQSDDPNVRAAAVEATRLMQAPEAEAVLAERMTGDKDIRVRSAALRSVQRRQPTNTLVTAVSSVARTDADIAPRQQATQILATWLPNRPDVRPTLESIAEKDQRDQIREIARKALGKG